MYTSDRISVESVGSGPGGPECWCITSTGGVFLEGGFMGSPLSPAQVPHIGQPRTRTPGREGQGWAQASLVQAPPCGFGVVGQLKWEEVLKAFAVVGKQVSLDFLVTTDGKHTHSDLGRN